MILLAGLGVDPWDVFHQGLSRRLGLGVGTWAVIVGLIVLALWIPLRQRPGLGTVFYALSIGPLAHYFLPRLDIDSRPTQSGQELTSPSAEPPVAAVIPGGGPDGT